MDRIRSSSEAHVLVMANCTHVSLALALRESGLFASVDSAELYSMSEEEREKLAGDVERYDYVITLEHGDYFGALSTDKLRSRLGERLFSLPTPFFSGLMPDMAYLRYDNEIARTAAVLGDYHSALILEEVRSGFTRPEIVRRYVSGVAFDRLDVEGVWNDNLTELKAREENTDIAISSYIEQAAAMGTIAGQFLSFNHPTEGLINYIAQDFIRRTTGQDCDRALVTRATHNLYSDAYWPLHPVVAERLGLPRPEKTVFKQPARLGGAHMEMDEFVGRSVDFFTAEHDPQKFDIATPHYLSGRIAPVDPGEIRQAEEARPKPMKTDSPKKIVMTHFGRSGSTVLTGALKQHSKIAWLEEYFSLKWINSRETYDFTLDQMIGMIDAEVAKVHAQNPDLLVGHEIKLMNFLQNPSCNMIDYARATTDPNEYIHIVLRRKNVLKRICSVYKAAQTKVYHVGGEDQAYRDKTFSIDFSNLVDYDTGQKADTFPELIAKSLARENEVLTNFRNAGIKYLELTYEDDIESDPLDAYHKIVDYLGLEYEPARVSLKKTSGSLKKDLTNFDELEAAMQGSEYAWMLD
ncbi:hypothetical protein IT775_02885 [Thalassobius aquimarinus]|uniref:Sulphotransferase Stf0 domain-containing protein n=2 Tax=Thalassovita aquimarina TaxID=2785917 RepID=A0ABS5HM63_9RHOB|nr:hypothetical protein [Thalassovita aquimarina]